MPDVHVTPAERYQHDPVFHALTHLLWRWGFTARLDPYRATTLVEALEAQGITLTTTTEGSIKPCRTQT